MSNSVLLDKSKELALEVIRLCNGVKTNKKESVLTNQLVRSGTSVGANIREAFMLTARPTLSQDYILR
jgi:four helix bundle protein